MLPRVLGLRYVCYLRGIWVHTVFSRRSSFDTFGFSLCACPVILRRAAKLQQAELHGPFSVYFVSSQNTVAEPYISVDAVRLGPSCGMPGMNCGATFAHDATDTNAMAGSRWAGFNACGQWVTYAILQY